MRKYLALKPAAKDFGGVSSSSINEPSVRKEADQRISLLGFAVAELPGTLVRRGLIFEGIVDVELV